MVTGERAFARSNTAQTLVALIREEPKPIVELSPKTPTHLRWIIERCLAKDPEDRYASTLDLARELQVLRDRLSEVDRPESVPSAVIAPQNLRRRRTLVSIGLATAALGI